MLTLQATTQFRKDYKLAKKRGLNMALLESVLSTLLARNALAPKYRDHALVGSYKDFRECHIQPDWLLIYRVDAEALVLVAVRTGSHADLFDE